MANKKIKEKIIAAVEKCLINQKKVGILFSGGLDSSVIAKIASGFCKTTCYCAGLEASQDVAFAEQAAGALGVRLRTKIIDKKEVGKYAEKVAAAIGMNDRMHVSVGIPLYACCELAEEKVLLSGTGADEVFGGYAKFRRLEGEQLAGELKKSYEKMLAVDLKRDLAIGKANAKEIRAPYLALGEPTGEVGKTTLRKTALELGVPAFIAERPKKAAQYGSGVERELRRLTRA